MNLTPERKEFMEIEKARNRYGNSLSAYEACLNQNTCMGNINAEHHRLSAIFASVTYHKLLDSNAPVSGEKPNEGE